MNDKYITVSQLTRYIKYKIDNDVNLNEVFLKGEISNFKAHTTGHLYFSLKDETSKINAIMFSRSATKLNFHPKDGDKVFSVATKGIFNEHGYPRIEEFEFDSSSQFHLLLKDKGLLHETLEEAVKCFEKDYNMFKEMREGIKNQ